MIRKFVLTASIFFSGIILLNAQCTPDPNCTSAVCPDVTVNLPHAAVSVLYSTTITVIVPATYQSYTIDSLNFVSVTGLPTGFTAIPNSMGWDGGQSGCILITGTPTNSMQGSTYNLTINSVIHSGTFSLPYPFTGYKIVVDSASGISDMNLNKFSLNQNLPNPFSKTTKILFTSPDNEKYNFSVLNVIGEKAFEKVINASVGENTIEFSAGELPSGIYLYKLSNNKETYTRRMVVAGK